MPGNSKKRKKSKPKKPITWSDYTRNELIEIAEECQKIIGKEEISKFKKNTQV